VSYASYDTLSAEDIHKLFNDQVSPGFIQRILLSLAGDKLVTIEQYDETSSKRYTLSDEGFEKIEQLPSLQKLLKEFSSPPSAIPASDRIVSRQDNQPAFDEISRELDEVIDALQTDNEIGAALSDEKEILLAEVKAGKELTQPGRFNLQRFAALLIPALKFISEKFAGAEIGEVAKHLFNLIMKLF
jgi:DNA-binding PadR family transcriptional regulator